jgi:hypothetical protein
MTSLTPEIAPPGSAGRRSRRSPGGNVRDGVRGFLADESGAVFLEFLIVLFAFMFILFGVIQVALISMASLFANYANFMALRTASVQYELFEDNFISQAALDLRCRATAAAALGPMEAYLYRHPTDITANADLQTRLTFTTRTRDPQVNGRPAVIQGRLQYQYYLIVPFAGNVIAAFGAGQSVPDNPRVMHDFAWQGGNAIRPYPLLRLRTSNDLSTEGGGPPFFHDMLIQRRWVY